MEETKNQTKQQKNKKQVKVKYFQGLLKLWSSAVKTTQVEYRNNLNNILASFFIWNIKEFFLQIESCTVLVTILINIFARFNYQYTFSLLGLYIFSFTFKFVLNFYLFMNKYRIYKKFNSKLYNVLSHDNEKDGKIYQQKMLSELEIGDIIKLDQGMVSPVNMIILTSYQSGNFDTCVVENYLIDGQLKVQKKKGLDKLKPKIPISNNENTRKYKRSLTFSLEFDDIDDCSKFKGLIKLKKDPKPEEITINNIILEQAMIRSKGVLGVILKKHDMKFDFLDSLQLKGRLLINMRFLMNIVVIFTLFVILVIFILTSHIQNQETTILYYQSVFLGITSVIPLNIFNFITLQNIIFAQQLKKKIKNLEGLPGLPMSSRPVQKMKSSKQNIIKPMRSHTPMFKRRQLASKTLSFSREFRNKPKKEEKQQVFEILNPNKISDFANIGSICFSKNQQMIKKKYIIKSVADIKNYYGVKYTNGQESKISVSSQSQEGYKTPTGKKKNLGALLELPNNKLKKLGFSGYTQPKKKMSIQPELLNPTYRISISRSAQPDKFQNTPEKSDKQPKKSDFKSFLQKNETLARSMIYDEVQKKAEKKNKDQQKLNQILSKWRQKERSPTNSQNKSMVSYNGPEDLNLGTIKVRMDLNNEFNVIHNELIQSLLDNIGFLVDSQLCTRKEDEKRVSSISYMDQGILNFFNHFNTCIKKTRYGQDSGFSGFNVHCKVGQKKFKMKILCLDANKDNTYLRFYIYDQTTLTIKLILRTQDEKVVKDCLKRPKEVEILNQIIRENTKSNLHSVFYTNYELSQEDSKIFYQEFLNLTKRKINPKEYLNKETLTQWQYMQLYTVLGFKEELEKTSKLIPFLKEANIRLCLLNSCDSISNQLIIQQYNFRYPDLITLNMKFKSVENGTQYFNELFEKQKKVIQTIVEDNIDYKQKLQIYLLKQKFFHQKQFAISTCGKTLEVIFKDPYLYQNFKFFLKYSNSFYCHSMKPVQKEMIVELLQELESDRNVCAIGYGKKDKGMLIKANVSVQLGIDKAMQISDIDGDILTNSQDLIEPLIFDYTQGFYKHSMNFQLQISFMIIFFMTRCVNLKFSKRQLLTSFPNIFMLTFIQYTFVNQFLINLSLRGCKSNRPQKRIYYQGIVNFERHKLSNFFVNIIEGVFIGTFTYLSTSFFFDNLIFPDFQVSQEESLMVFFFVDVTYISLRFYVIDPEKSNYLLICCLINVVANLATFFVFQYYFFREVFDRLAQNMFRFEFLLIYTVMILGSLNLSYIYDILLRRYFNDDLLFIKELMNVKNKELILKSFLKKWFNRQKKTYFPKILYNIFKLKNTINPILLEFTYPQNLFIGDNTIQKFYPDFSSEFIAKTYIFMKMFAHKLKRVKLILLFIVLIIGFSIARYLSNDQVFVVDFVFLLFVAFINLYVIKEWNLANGLEKFMKSIIIILNIIITISFFQIPQFLFIFQIALSVLIVKANEISFRMYFFTIIYQNLALVCGILIEQFWSGKSGNTFANIATIGLTIGFQIVLISWNYRIHLVKKKNLLMKFRLKKMQKVNNDLLTFLMPKFILSRLNFDVDDKHLADDAGEVTIMFVYICNFEKILEGYKDDIINLLDNIFKDFDILCDKYEVQKIETVGNTYVAACGGKVGEDKQQKIGKDKAPIKRTFDLAIQFNNIIKQHQSNNRNELKLKIKIGIHTGPCMMGVIGYHKPQFSLIGDTVNTTSRVCSTGEEGRIMLSQQAQDKLEEFTIDKKWTKECKLTFMKGKGMQNVYHYFQKRGQRGTFKKKIMNLMKMKKFQSGSKKGNSTKVDGIGRKYQKSANKKLKNVFNQFSNFQTNRKKEQRLSRMLTIKMMSREGQSEQEFIHKKISTSKQQIARKSVENDNKSSSQYFNSEQDDFLETEENIEFEPIKSDEWLTMNSLQNTFLKEFFKHLYDSQKKYLISNMLIMIIAWVVINIFILFKQNFEIKNLVWGKLILIIFMMILSSVKKVQKSTQLNYYKETCFLLIYLTLLQFQFLEFINHFNIEDNFMLFMEEIIIATGLYQSQKIMYKNAFFVCLYFVFLKIIFLFIIRVQYDMTQSDFVELVEYFLASAVLYIAFTITKYMNFEEEIEFFNQHNQEQQKNSQINDFINRLMPKHVQEILKNPNAKLAESYDDVTIIYADICGFTNYSANKKPEEVVNMLSRLFTDFDKQCEALEIYKVYTIGDCYVALGFLDKDKRTAPQEEAYKIIQFAFKMVEIIGKVRKEINFPALDMRIGIHTGKIIGGVIGTDIIRFDIYGKDVIIANKMESKGTKGKINISESTKKMIEYYNDFKFIENEKLVLKNETVKMYFVEKVTD